jgi:hypothetical protein
MDDLGFELVSNGNPFHDSIQEIMGFYEFPSTLMAKPIVGVVPRSAGGTV